MDYVLFFHSFQFYSTEVWFAFAVPSPQPLLISMVKVMNHSGGQVICMLITANPYTLTLCNPREVIKYIMYYIEPNTKIKIIYICINYMEPHIKNKVKYNIKYPN